MIFVLCFPAEQRQSNQNALLPSTGISRWCWLSAWMLQGWMLSKCLEGCILLMWRQYFPPPPPQRCTNFTLPPMICIRRDFNKQILLSSIITGSYSFLGSATIAEWEEKVQSSWTRQFSQYCYRQFWQIIDKSSEGSRSSSWLSGPQSSPACCGRARTVQSY